MRLRKLPNWSEKDQEGGPSGPPSSHTRWYTFMPPRWYAFRLPFTERVKNLTGLSEPDDFVFCDQDGNKVSEGAFSKTFKKLLKDAELLKNAEGMDRTLYSLRHTYATFRIELGKLRPEELADMMGTSPQNIYNHYRHSLLRENASKLTQR